MLRTTLATSQRLRVSVFALVTVAAGPFANQAAQAHTARHHSYARHAHHQEDSYSPAFSSIIVDGNSGATLQANNPDASRHPASLTKIMTLFLLFERLDAGKLNLDSELQVSEHASEQAPTKLGLRPGQTIRVEDAIKGLVTRSANDAAVVIAEALAGEEDDFARLMTRKARALGMTRTVYRNASGLPDDDQVTTARDQSTLGRAIQERFPRYYRYFSTTAFNYHGESIRNHNHLLGSVEGVDGIKTGYTRASGFNLVTSMRRGNRHLIGVVMGGRSGGSRDAIMRNLLAENLDKASTTHTVAAIREKTSGDEAPEMANNDTGSRPTPTVPTESMVEVASASDEANQLPTGRSNFAAPQLGRASSAAGQAAQAKPDPAPLINGIMEQAPGLVPGSSEPMKPVKVKTVPVRAGALNQASIESPHAVVSTAATVSPSRAEQAAISGSVAASGDAGEPRHGEFGRPEWPPQPAHHGTGNGLLGVLPASSLPAGAVSQAMAYADPTPRSPPSATAQLGAGARPLAVHTGWIIQVGALDSEDEARQRIDAARNQAHGLLANADPFTESVVSKGDHKLFRARFAGLDRGQAESVCRALRRSDISCITVKN